LILEKKDRAIKRKARLYGKLTKISIVSEAYHETRINPEGSSISLLLNNLLGDSIHIPDYISLHGTATKNNDISEVRGIKKYFGRNVDKILLSAIKPFTGHMIGASSIVELISCLLTIRDDFIPPVLNLNCPDTECDLNFVTGKGKKKIINKAVSLSYGFGSLLGGALVTRY
ncbi:beta-ketoacyl-[acyl-carrier-protein] synthase II, partial [Chlamydiota bacterium]